MDAGFDYAEKASVDVYGHEIPQILLIHCNELNSLTLRESIARMRARGYAFITLEEAMQDAAYQRPDTFAGTWRLVALADGHRHRKEDFAAERPRAGVDRRAGEALGLRFREGDARFRALLVAVADRFRAKRHLLVDQDGAGVETPAWRRPLRRSCSRSTHPASGT